jgi:hypothetical protein
MTYSGSNSTASGNQGNSILLHAKSRAYYKGLNNDEFKRNTFRTGVNVMMNFQRESPMSTREFIGHAYAYWRRSSDTNNQVLYFGGDLYRISLLGEIIGSAHENHIYKTRKNWEVVYNIPIVYIYKSKKI